MDPTEQPANNVLAIHDYPSSQIWRPKSSTDNSQLTFEDDAKRPFTDFLSDSEMTTDDAIGSSGRYVVGARR